MKKRGRDKTKFNLKVFITCILIVIFVALIGSVFTTKSVNSSWYQSIKPTITPPNIIFPIVWSVLFFLIAISLYFAWTKSTKKQKLSVAIVFIFNFFFNILWTILYFGLNNIQLALIDLVLLWVSIIAVILVTKKISKASAYLLIPYLAWVTFAGVLNYLSLR
jgi:tryptophan-rich sensory protein